MRGENVAARDHAHELAWIFTQDHRQAAMLVIEHVIGRERSEQSA